MESRGGAGVVEAEGPGGIDGLNARLGGAVKLALVPIAKLRLLKKNARFMKSDTFKTLVNNIKEDGVLTSIPFCVKKGEEFEVLSGNHRVQAAEKAGLTEILILYTDRELTRQKEVAIQLSHNALSGQDDPVILKELWREIEDVGLKYYSGLDDKALNELAEQASAALSDVRLEFRTLSFVFLPEECERLDKIFEEAIKRLRASDRVLLARRQEFERVLDALAALRKKKNIRSAAVGLMTVLDWFEAQKIGDDDGQGAQADADAAQGHPGQPGQAPAQ